MPENRTRMTVQFTQADQKIMEAANMVRNGKVQEVALFAQAAEATGGLTA